MEFVPSDAYIILGHGKEPEFREPKNEIKQEKVKAEIPTIGTILNNGFVDSDSSFIVPANCMIVVKAVPGEIINMYKVINKLNIVGSNSKQELYRNPLSNTKKVISDLGSVVIFKPGDRCPNFEYLLFLSGDQLFFDWGEDSNALSHFGLIKTPLKKNINFIWNELDDTVVDSYNNMYNESVVPTKEEITTKLLEFSEDKDASLLQLFDHDTETSGKYLKDISRFLTITQKEFLQIGEDGIAKRPGVYYNFICRLSKEGNKSYMKFSKNTGKYTINPRINSYMKQPATIRQLLGRKILEAETKRKPLIRNLYTGGKKRRTRTRKIIKRKF